MQADGSVMCHGDTVPKSLRFPFPEQGIMLDLRKAFFKGPRWSKGGVLTTNNCGCFCFFFTNMKDTVYFDNVVDNNLKI